MAKAKASATLEPVEAPAELKPRVTRSASPADRSLGVLPVGDKTALTRPVGGFRRIDRKRRERASGAQHGADMGHLGHIPKPVCVWVLVERHPDLRSLWVGDVANRPSDSYELVHVAASPFFGGGRTPESS